MSGIDPLAVGTEIKLARMFRENAPTKAMRYLVEGRIIIRHVDAERVVAQVRGREVYDVEWLQASGWSCSCQARSTRCAHITALRHITARGDA